MFSNFIKAMGNKLKDYAAMRKSWENEKQEMVKNGEVT
jgi:hypothetical protein